MTMCLLVAKQQVNQAEAVLNLWSENPHDNYTRTLIMAVMTLLDGVAESIMEAEVKLDRRKQ